MQETPDEFGRGILGLFAQRDRETVSPDAFWAPRVLTSGRGIRTGPLFTKTPKGAIHEPTAARY